MRTFLIAALALVGCVDPGPEVGREIGVDEDVGGMELVSVVESGPIVFSDLGGDDPRTLGFHMVGRVLSGEPRDTTVALRINGVDWGYYYWRVVNLNGVLAADSTTIPVGAAVFPAPYILLHAGVLDTEAALTLKVDIPVSGQSGDGFNQGIDVQWQATVQSLGESLTGSGTTLWTAEVDSLEVFPVTGSLAVSGSRVALYRLLR